MAKKQIFHGAEAQKILLEGVKITAKAVKTTLGPHGSTVIIDQKYGAPVATKDGVRVAKAVDIKGPENIGAQLVKTAAVKTNSIVGDGTTTTTVLVESLVEEGIKNITAGSKPIDVKRGIEKAKEAVLKSLRAQKKDLKSKQDLLHISKIAANGDERVGQIVADAIEKAGKAGVIIVEEGKSTETELDLVPGMQIDKGYLSPYFVTDHKKRIAQLDSPYILVTNKKITTLQEIVPVLELVSKSGRPLFIIADDIAEKALAILLVNHINVASPLKLGAMKSPGFGENRNHLLDDIATLVDAKVIDEARGYKLENVTLSDLGTAEKVVLKKDVTTILHGGGSREAVQNRVDQIQAEIEQTTSEYEREKLQKRLAGLAGAMVRIKVGGSTEVEMQERKDRTEDAVNATKSANEQGMLPGGGVALLRAAMQLDGLEGTLKNPDQVTGVQILKRALEAPTKHIVKNAGGQSAVVLQKLKEEKGAFGYDAYRNVYCDMYEAGIIDSLGVALLTVETAVSIGCAVLTTEALVYELPEEKDAAASPGMGQGMM